MNELSVKNFSRSISAVKKFHTLKFLLISSLTKRLLFVSEAFSGRQQDFSIFRQVIGAVSLKKYQLHVDLGFLGINSSGVSDKIFIPFKSRKCQSLTGWQKEVNRLLVRERVVVENAIAKMKAFFILRIKNRMWLKEKLTTAFQLCAGLANFKMQVNL